MDLSLFYFSNQITRNIETTDLGIVNAKAVSYCKDEMISSNFRLKDK